jgi:chromosome segregation ATPase
MSDFKESDYDLLLVLLCIAVLMLFVYIQQSRDWHRALEMRDQRISELDQKNSDHQKNLAKARETITGHEASAQKAAKDLQTARQIIGELQTRKLENEKEIATLKAVLKEKDSEIAKTNANLSSIKESTGKGLAAKEERATELEKTVADQTRKLKEAQAAIQRLEASEKQLQERLQAADKALAEQKENYQKLSDELDALKKEN